MAEDPQPLHLRPATPPHLLRFARRMRCESTDAEKRLWQILRDRRLAGFKFRRQVPMGPYILDFYCHEAKVVVEADGGQHDLPRNKDHDTARTNWLNQRGIWVLRFWDNDVLKHTEAVRRMIYRALTGEDPG